MQCAMPMRTDDNRIDLKPLSFVEDLLDRRTLDHECARRDTTTAEASRDRLDLAMLRVDLASAIVPDRLWTSRVADEIGVRRRHVDQRQLSGVDLCQGSRLFDDGF